MCSLSRVSLNTSRHITKNIQNNRCSYVYGKNYGLRRKHLRGVMYLKHAQVIASSSHTRSFESSQSRPKSALRKTLSFSRNTDSSTKLAYEKDPTRFAIRVPGKMWELKCDSVMIARRWIHQLRDCIAAFKAQDEGNVLPVCSGLKDVKIFGCEGDDA